MRECAHTHAHAHADAHADARESDIVRDRKREACVRETWMGKREREHELEKPPKDCDKATILQAAALKPLSTPKFQICQNHAF